MVRRLLVMVALAAAVGCRGDRQRAGDDGTASAYSDADDSGASTQRIEGTVTGTQLQAPALIPGVVTMLNQAKRQPSKANVTALRNGVGHLADAMRADLSRAGLADSGEFRALTDSLSRDFGGGAGGVAADPKPEEMAKVDTQVRRLIDLHERMMASTKK